MKLQFRISATVVLGSLALACGSAKGVTVILSEDFSATTISNGNSATTHATQFAAEFPGWTWADPGAVKFRTNPATSDLPGGSGSQAIQYEWTNAKGAYTFNQTWNAGDFFRLTVDVAPQSWNGTQDRYFSPTITQGATSWSLPGLGTLMDKYTGTPNWQTLDYIIPTTGFTSGSNATLTLASNGFRGVYFDNVNLTVGAPPVDNSPPLPDPPTWKLAPTMFDYTNVIMSVNPSSDPFGVEYLFTNTTTSQNSGWQDSTQWVQSELDQDTNYNFSVLARDKAPSPNMNTATATGMTTTGQLDGLIFASSFEYPEYSSRTSNPNLVGWTWTNGNSVRTAIGGSDGLSGDASNQALQFEYTNAFGTHASDHLWSPDEIYTISLNATPQAWNGQQARSVVATLLNQDADVLWSQTAELPLYNSAFQGQPWDLSQYFEFIVNGSDLALAQAGDTLSLRLSSAGFRGMYIDNVLFTFQSTVVPEPTTMGLITLSMMAMGMRRRRSA